MKKACYNCGGFDHLSYDCGKWVEQGKSWPRNNYTHKSRSPRTVFHKTDKTPAAVKRPNMNVAKPKRTSFYKLAHSCVRRHFQETTQDLMIILIQRVKRLERELKARTPQTKIHKDDVRGKSSATITLIFKVEDPTLRNIKKYADECMLFKKSKLKVFVPHKDLTCLVAKASAYECMLWHRRLGHLNFKTMNKLVRYNLVRGSPTKCFENDHNCTACLKGKQHKASCKTKLVNSVTKPLHTLHMELFGPTSDETSGILRNFITEIENLKELRVKIIKCDNGGEFRNKEMNDFCSRKGIKREFSNARTPQQKGVPKRRNKTLIEAARTMLADAKLSVTFWAEAVNTACYVQNRVLVNKSQNKTSYELFNGKFEEKGDESYFISTDAPESSGNSNLTATSTNPPAGHMETLAVETLIPTVSSPVPTACLNDSPEPLSDTRLISKRVTTQDNTPSLDNILTLTNRFEDNLGVTINTDDTNGVEADLGNMETTITNVWSLVDCPKEVRPIRTKWVLKNKKDKSGIVIRNKARLVAQGYTQEEGIDYDEVFAPVARIEAIKLFLAYTSFMGFTVYQMDVKSAFLYGTIDEEVYMMQPPGFQDLEFPARMYKVEKAMYGLHQAPRAWYGTLSKYLLTKWFSKGYNRSDSVYQKA
nr:hypothetical protein [Tanacetum cinerariifolium]